MTGYPGGFCGYRQQASGAAPGTPCRSDTGREADRTGRRGNGVFVKMVAGGRCLLVRGCHTTVRWTEDAHCGSTVHRKGRHHSHWIYGKCEVQSVINGLF